MSTRHIKQNNFRLVYVLLALILTFGLSIIACNLPFVSEETSEEAGIEAPQPEEPIEDQASNPTPTPTSTPTIKPTPTPTIKPTPTPTPSPTEDPIRLQEIAEEVAENVGEIDTVYEADSDTVVYIFGENHASRLQQLEIAIMLNRLYASQNLHHLGLEGLITDDSPMDLSWAHRPPPYEPGEPITNREDVLAHMLKDGEFSSIEFIGLIYEDVVVHGIDDADLYTQVVDDNALFAPFDYLYAIAISTMSDEDYTFWSDLYDDGDYDRAYEFAMLSTDFTQDAMERYENFQSPEEQRTLLEEIRAKGQEAGAELTPELELSMQELIDYTEVVAARSEKFVENTLNIAEENPGMPVAMEIGFVHMQKVMEALGEAGVSYVAIRPISYLLEEDPSLLSWEAYKRKEAGLSPGEPRTIGALLSEGRKPPATAAEERTEIEHGMREFVQWVHKHVEPLYTDKGVQDFSQLSEEEQEKLKNDISSIWDGLVNKYKEDDKRYHPNYQLSSFNFWLDRDGRFVIRIVIVPPTGREIFIDIVSLKTFNGKLYKFEENLDKLLIHINYELPDSVLEPEENPPFIEGLGVFYPACSDTLYAISDEQ